tara:strand:- start:483 stop:932 length:450 start_codon:yes stop_codon:yes gene_type:complete
MKFKWIKDFFLTNKKVLEPTLNVKKVNLDLEILELLIEIARIDGKLTLDEIALIKSFIIKSPILDANLIQDYIKNTAEKISLSENINLINSNLTKEEILEIIFELFQLSFIDEDIHLEEERLIYKIADLLRVKRNEIIMIKNRVLERSI